MINKKKNVKKVVEKLLVDRRPEEIAEAVLSSISWDRLLLAFANVAWNQGQKQPEKKLKKAWMGRGRIFHRAMDETYLKKSKGSIFKITRKDVYLCTCKKRFIVDAVADKNIAYDSTQCEFIVTCPGCGKQEDVKKARLFLEKKCK